ncbi:MAG TPA: M56 family metallopeptidase [Caproiciproducens sp.]|nr:M56 family metallopeptidase [Caproiciproducens sp.]
MTVLIGIFRWVLSATIPGCVLVLLILLVKGLFGRRVNASFHFGIWFLLIIRLLIPFSISSPASVLNLLIPFAQTGETLNTQWNSDFLQKPMLPSKKTSKLPCASVPKSSEKSRTNTTSSYTLLESSSAILWLSGALIYLIYALTINLRFTIQLKKGKPALDSRLQDIYRESKLILHISSDIPILSTEAVRSPSLCGILHPRLLIPEHLTEQISDEELKYIILHELAHWKRKDIPVILVATVLKALYWFNPFIWYAMYRMRQDCEVSCDGLVLSHIRPEERNRYGHLLLHLLDLGIQRKAVPRTACILSTDKRHLIKRRIVMISNYRKPTSKQIVLTAVLAAAVIVTGMTGAVQVPASAQAVSAGSILSRSLNPAIAATGKDAATYWADTLAYRNGAFRFALLSDELKQKEYKTYAAARWVIGGSSPWVTGYTISEDGKTDAGTKFKIDYTFSDSTKSKYVGSETITVKQKGSDWQVVQHENLDSGYPSFTQVQGSNYAQVQKTPPILLPVRTAQETANLWARALENRNGAFRFAVLNDDLRAAESDAYQKISWVIGGSSPWVVSYRVTPVSQASDSAEYRISYLLADSTKSLYESTENISLKNYGGVWLVTKHNDYIQMPDFAPKSKS